VPLEVKSFPARYLILFIISIIALLAVQGCATAAVPAVAYGVSKITEPKTGSAQAVQPAARRTYPEYLTEMERINTEREKAGLSPRPIMTQDEWVKAEAAGRPAPTPTSVPAPAPPAAPASAAAACEKAAETK
jgi:hypothetical protein